MNLISPLSALILKCIIGLIILVYLFSLIWIIGQIIKDKHKSLWRKTVSLIFIVTFPLIGPLAYFIFRPAEK
ncbi:MAG: hypothetical protein AABZ56_04810 [Bacteroidota bacterium]